MESVNIFLDWIDIYPKAHEYFIALYGILLLTVALGVHISRKHKKKGLDVGREGDGLKKTKTMHGQWTKKT